MKVANRLILIFAIFAGVSLFTPASAHAWSVNFGWGKGYKDCDRDRYVYRRHYRYWHEPVVIRRVVVPREEVFIAAKPACPVKYTGGARYYDVNIPTRNNGYTTVTIKEKGDGYVGPQGEYYPDFPTVDQLRVMYGQ